MIVIASAVGAYLYTNLSCYCYVIKQTVMASECNERGHPVTIFWIATRFALAMTLSLNVFVTTLARHDDIFHLLHIK